MPRSSSWERTAETQARPAGLLAQLALPSDDPSGSPVAHAVTAVDRARRRNESAASAGVQVMP
jgi:hypothetical protein